MKLCECVLCLHRTFHIRHMAQRVMIIYMTVPLALREGPPSMAASSPHERCKKIFYHGAVLYVFGSIQLDTREGAARPRIHSG